MNNLLNRDFLRRNYGVLVLLPFAVWLMAHIVTLHRSCSPCQPLAQQLGPLLLAFFGAIGLALFSLGIGACLISVVQWLWHQGTGAVKAAAARQDTFVWLACAAVGAAITAVYTKL